MKHNNNLQNILSIPYPLLMFRDITHHGTNTVSYTHLRAHETPEHLVCRLLLEKKKNKNTQHT